MNSYIIPRMKHKRIFIIIGIILLGISIFYYIDTVFLPIQFKRYVVTKAEKYLQRQVSINSINFKPIKGFIIDTISISRKDDPDKPFIKVKQVTLSLLLAPIFQKKAVIIPHIKISDPYAFVSRDKNSQWNFQDLLDLRKTTRRKLPSILLRKLMIENGKLDYSDRTQEVGFDESIEHINLNSTLSLNKGIRFVAGLKIPKHKTVVKIKGNYSLLAKKLTTQISLNNIQIAQYLSLAGKSQSYVTIDKGILSSADLNLNYAARELQAQGAFVITGADVLIGEYKQLSGTIDVPEILLTWRDKKWDAKGHVKIPSVHMKALSGKEFWGDVSANLSLLTIDGENIVSQGNVAVDNARLKIAENQYLSGNIMANNASLSSQNNAIRISGNFDIKETVISIDKQKTIKGHISTEGTKLEWSSPDNKGSRRLSIESGLKFDSTLITLGPDKTINGTINVKHAKVAYSQRRVTIESQGYFNNIDIKWPANKQFKGDPYFDILYVYDPKNDNPTDYKGMVKFSKSQLTQRRTSKEN